MEAVKSHTEDVTSRMEDTTADTTPSKDQTAPAIACMEAVRSHTAPLIVPIASEKSNTEVVTVHAAAITAKMQPFEPADTTHEKMVKPFLFERVFAP